METLNRDECVELIESHYFGGVMAADLHQIRSCFTDDAIVTIRHGDRQPRLFSLQPLAGHQDLMSFYEHICGEYDCWFGHFRHYIDAPQQSAASTFEVRLTPKPGGAYDGWAIQTLYNCNFFNFRDRRIFDMLIYYSNPGAGENPTGYPQ